MSVIFPEWMADAKEKYNKARKLIKNSKHDPVTEPYKSRYAARDILLELLNSLNQLCEQSGEAIKDWELFIYALFSSLYRFNLGTIALETEEIQLAVEYFESCVKHLEPWHCRPESCILLIETHNRLGLLWSGRDKPEVAHEHLKEAEAMYPKYKSDNQPLSVDLMDLFEEGTETDPVDSKNLEKMNIENAHTHTLYYLAQVCGHLGRDEESATYCLSTLRRQIESGKFDAVDWAVNAATLSQFFIVRDYFAAARNCLACATAVLSDHKGRIGSSPALEEKTEELRRGQADVARCWAKYGLLLLTVSRESLLEADSDVTASLKGTEEEAGKFLPQLLFTRYDVSEVEAQITDKHVLDFNQARLVFLTTQKQLNEAMLYYTMEDHAFDHVQILQDLSKLYKELIFFESDTERQCKMHKRRIDILEDVLSHLNPKYYLLVCRQLMFELADTYAEMMSIKLSNLTSNSKTTPHAAKKINALGQKAVCNYNRFVETLKGTDGKLPEKFADDVVRPALIANFCMGRLYSKMILPDQKSQLEYLAYSEKCYQFIVDYVQKNPEHESVIKEEMGMAKEMAQLIASKIQSILNSTMF